MQYCSNRRRPRRSHSSANRFPSLLFMKETQFTLGNGRIDVCITWWKIGRPFPDIAGSTGKESQKRDMSLTQDIAIGFSKAGSSLSDVREDSSCDDTRCRESNVRSVFNGCEDSVGVSYFATRRYLVVFGIRIGELQDANLLRLRTPFLTNTLPDPQDS